VVHRTIGQFRKRLALIVALTTVRLLGYLAYTLSM